MSSTDSKEQGKSETVLPIKKKRQFTWTEKRTAQFEKMKKMNAERKKEKKEKEGKEKPKLESEEEKKEEEGEEVEDKQSKRIMKRVMDKHFLARKDRHTVGTTSEPSSESENDSSELSESEEDSDSSEEIRLSKRKKGKKRSYSEPKQSKLQKQIESLRAKNKQLQSLFVTTKIKKPRKKYESEGSDEDYQEEEEYERPSKRSVDKVPIERPAAPYFFC